MSGDHITYVDALLIHLRDHVIGTGIWNGTAIAFGIVSLLIMFIVIVRGRDEA